MRAFLVLALIGTAVALAARRSYGAELSFASVDELNAATLDDGSLNIAPTYKLDDESPPPNVGINEQTGTFSDPPAFESDFPPEDQSDMTSQIAALDLATRAADFLSRPDIEGFREYVYDDVNGKPWSQSHLGNPTIGYGHKLERTDDLTQTWSRETARQVLLQDVLDRIAQLEPAVAVELSINEWVALISLAFNAGVGAVKKSRLLAAINASDDQTALAQWLDWCHATITLPDGSKQKRVVAGLQTRRQTEWNLYAVGGDPISIA
jgi:lysozyme